MKRVRIETPSPTTGAVRGGGGATPPRGGRALPLAVLALVGGALALVVLSQATAARRHPRQGGGGGASRTPASSEGGSRTPADSASLLSNGSRPVRLAPLLSRNATPVEVNALRLRLELSARRVAEILEGVRGPRSLGTETPPPLMPYCPQVPPRLDGPLFPEDHVHQEDFPMEEVIRSNSDVHPGGAWHPDSCSSRHRVAVIIPYRDRQDHLSTLLSHLHPILKKQQLDYKIYVAEQSGNGTFNKGILMNAAFLLSMREANYRCFVFHDVDLIPEDDRNMYSCPQYPRHMSVAVNEFQYKLPYTWLVGGVFSISTNHFLRVNGYSNLYWGWGGEDDDMSARILTSGLTIIRPSSAIARYRMIKHVKRKPLIWKIRGKLLGTAKRRMRYDGLNTLNYTLIGTTVAPLYTNFTIDVGRNPFPIDIQ